MKKIENFIRYFLKKLKINEAEFASAYLAFYILLSLIPILVFISNLIVIVVPNFSEFIFELVENLPNDVQNILLPILNNIFKGSSSSLSIISILSALWLGSRGFQGLIKALNKIFEVKTTSKIPFYDKIFSVLLAIAFMITLASLLLFSVFNEKILGLIRNILINLNINSIEIMESLTNILLNGILTLMPYLLSAILLAFLYALAPSFNKDNRPGWKSIIIGSIVGTLGISLVTFFYKFSNDVLQRSPSIYGSLGSIIVTLIWLLAVCNMMIWGAAFIKTYDDVVLNKKSILDLDPDTKFLVDKIKNK